MTLIRCIVCSRQFDRQHPNHKYCGETCKRKADYRRPMTTRECPVCKLFYDPIHCDQVYCGQRCKDRQQYLRKVASMPPKESKSCMSCGASFIPRANQKFCKLECGYTADLRAKRKQDRGGAKCVSCAKPLAADRRKYCTNECRNKVEVGRSAMRQRIKADQERKQYVYTRFGGKIDKEVVELGTGLGLGAYTIAQVRQANEVAGPLEGCERCKRRTGHDNWCPNGEG